MVTSTQDAHTATFIISALRPRQYISLYCWYPPTRLCNHNLLYRCCNISKHARIFNGALYCHISVSVAKFQQFSCEKTSTLNVGNVTDNHCILINWKNHIDQIIPKLSAAFYMVKQMYYICNNDTLRSIYFAYFHSIASYGIILGGNSFYSKKIRGLEL